MADSKGNYWLDHGCERVKYISFLCLGLHNYVIFDVNKPRKFGHRVELAARVSKLQLWKFFLNNFPLSRSVSLLKIDIFLLSFIWSFIKQVVISLPLKQMRRMLQEVFRHGIIELVLRTVMYLIGIFRVFNM